MANSPEKNGRPGRREIAGTLLRVLQFLVVSVCFFAWWMAMLLLVSLIAVNVWHVRFTEILFLSLGLTGVSAAVYLWVMLNRKKKSS